MGNIPSIRHFDYIALDCDGVIFDSNQLKTEGFRQVCNKNNISKEITNQFVAYHIQNGGISRYVKFKELINSFLNIPFDNAFYQSLLADYASICLKMYDDIPTTTGLMSFLSQTKEMNIPLYIVSGGDERELNAVFETRGIKNYFVEILGSPKTKPECLENILAFQKGNGLFIGDAKADFRAASGSNLAFCAMYAYSESISVLKALEQEHGFFSIDNLGQLVNE